MGFNRTSHQCQLVSLSSQFPDENKEKTSVCVGHVEWSMKAQAGHTHGEHGFARPPAGSQLGEERPPGGIAEPPCALEETWENVGDPQTPFFSPIPPLPNSYHPPLLYFLSQFKPSAVNRV